MSNFQSLAEVTPQGNGAVAEVEGSLRQSNTRQLWFEVGNQSFSVPKVMGRSQARGAATNTGKTATWYPNTGVTCQASVCGRGRIMRFAAESAEREKGVSPEVMDVGASGEGSRLFGEVFTHTFECIIVHANLYIELHHPFTFLVLRSSSSGHNWPSRTDCPSLEILSIATSKMTTAEENAPEI